MSWRDEMYTANEKALQAEVRRLRNVVRDLEVEKRKSGLDSC